MRALITRSLDVAPLQPKTLHAPRVTSGATPEKFYASRYCLFVSYMKLVEMIHTLNLQTFYRWRQ